MHIETYTKTPTQSIASVARARRRAIVAVAALACAALMSACGSSSSSTGSTAAKNLDTKRVALSIEESVLAKRNLHATVSCPASVPQEKGKTFVCIATTRSPKKPFAEVKTPFKVTVVANNGYATYVGE
jgi:hypothetical protein